MKTRSLRSPKIKIFAKGIVHGFGENLVIFHRFVFGKIRHENVFHDVLKRKNAFLYHINKKFNTSKN